MSRYTPISLDLIPAPDVVEALDFETILGEMRADLIARAPELAAVLTLESDPLSKLLEVCAWRELILRARVNDAARAVMLATATGADLDNLAALFGVARLVVQVADATVSPPVPVIMETDDALRARTQLALEGFSTAGPVGAYDFHARTADGRVRDVAIMSPAPGLVQVVLLSHEGDGTAGSDLIGAVSAALNAEEVRPLCDTVFVRTADIVPFQVTATLTLAAEPGADVVIAEARAAVAAYLAGAFRVGRVIRRSALLAALHRPGVEMVTLTAPAADVDPGETGAARATNTTIGYEVAE